MNKYLTIGFAASCLLVACCLAQSESTAQSRAQAGDTQQVTMDPADTVKLFKRFCYDTTLYVRQSLDARNKGLVPNFMLYLMDDGSGQHQDARAHLEGLMNNPQAELRKLDNFMAEQQRQVLQRLAERPFRPTALLDHAHEQVQSFFRDPAAHMRGVDNFLAEQQRQLAERLHKQPFQPGNFFKEAMDRLHSVAGRVAAAPKALLNETCDAFDQYREEIERRFADTKQQLVAYNRGLNNVELEDIGCAVVQRVDNVRRSCADMRAKKQTETAQ